MNISKGESNWLLALFGKIKYDENYDYKRDRKPKRPAQPLP
jgi:hypothetical protein